MAHALWLLPHAGIALHPLPHRLLAPELINAFILFEMRLGDRQLLAQTPSSENFNLTAYCVLPQRNPVRYASNMARVCIAAFVPVALSLHSLFLQAGLLLWMLNPYCEKFGGG